MRNRVAVLWNRAARRTRSGDQQLVRRVQSAAAGAEFAFARIVGALHEQVFGICMVVCRDICMVVCRDRLLAEESARSTWSQVWRKLNSVKRPDRLRRWVVSVAFNEAKQALRRTRRHSRVAVSGLALDPPGGVDPATGIAGIDLRLALQDLDPEVRVADDTAHRSSSHRPGDLRHLCLDRH